MHMIGLALNSLTGSYNLAVYFQYLGRTHNLWYRSCLLLEQIAFENGPTSLVKSRSASEYEFEPSNTPVQVDMIRFYCYNLYISSEQLP